MKRLLIVAVALLASGQASAEEFKRVPASLDPAKAYVVVELGQLDDAMLPGTLLLSRYDEGAGDILLPKSAGAAGRGQPQVRQSIAKHVYKEGQRRLSLVAVEPGLWVVEGANDTAFSLCSSTIRLDAGTVTDLGVAKIYSDFPDGEKQDVLTAGRMFKGALMGGLFGRTLPKPMPRAVDFRPRSSSDLSVPAELGEVRPVAWDREVRFGNYMGGMVNRMGGRKARFRALAAEQAAAVAAEEVDTDSTIPSEANSEPNSQP